MMLLQVVNDFLSNPSLIAVGSGIGATAGSITTMLVNKVLNRKKDTADIDVINYDIVDKQLKMLWEQMEQQGKVIKELQAKACYREPCDLRINGKAVAVKLKSEKK